MEEKELLEIEAREMEQAAKNTKEMIRRNETSSISLLYKDKFDLEKKRVCSPLAGVLTDKLIPLHEKVLVPIAGHPSPEKFNERIGFSVDRLVEWRKRGWVETVLTAAPRVYSGLGYLDELIQVSPSLSVRSQVYLVALSGGADRFNTIFREGLTVFKESVVPPRYVEIFGEHRAEDYRKTLATYYTDLSIFGLAQSIKEINDLAKNKIQDAEDLCIFSQGFLVSPFIRSLGKTTTYPSEFKGLATPFYEIAKPKGEAFFVPCWLADVYDYLGLTAPESMDTDEINAVKKNSGKFIEAAKSLDEEIDKAVREKFEGQELERSEEKIIIAKREEFRRTWREELVPAFKDIRQTEEVWSIAFTTSIVASALALSALKGVLDIPSSIHILLASKELKEKIADPAAGYFVGFWERNPIHIGFYKVDKEIRKLKRRS